MRLVPGDNALRLAISVVVQIAGVVLLALAADWTVARRNAALRHGIWLAALTWVCVAPVAAWGLQRSGITFWRTPVAVNPREPIGEGAKVVTDAAPLIFADVRTSDQTNVESGAVRHVTPGPSANRPLAPAASGKAFVEVVGALIAIWAAGVLLLSVRLVWGLRVVARLRRELIPLGDLPGVVADRLRRTLGVKALPSIMLSPRLAGPAAIGFHQPVVVLPAELAAAMNPSELYDALAHECAHALRGDARIALVQRFVAIIYWIHPLVHVLNRQLARAREEVCDNVVLTGTSAAEYARTLLALSQAIQTSRGRIEVMQMFDLRWRLAQRVEGILNARRIVMTRMNRRATVLVAAIAFSLGTALAAISTAGDEPQNAKLKPMPTPMASQTNTSPTNAEPIIITVSKPVEREVTDSEVFAGRIEAAQSVNIVSRVTGYLTKADFKEGADVKKGDLLFEIDPRPYQAQVEQGQAELRVNEARLQGARAEFERASEIAKTGAISQQELDKGRATRQEATAALEAAKEKLRGHELTLSFCKIVAPIDGRGGRYNLTLGNLVIQDQTVLTTIASLDPVYAYFDVDERSLLRIRKAAVADGPKQPAAGTEMPAFLNVLDERGFPHRGTVNFISDQVDPSTGTISMRAVFANPESKGGTRLFMPGMFVRVQLPIGKPYKALLVIDSALRSDQEMKIVYVAGPNNVIEQRRVKTGALQEDGLRVIDSGLHPDERVVVGDLRQVHPSMTVQQKLVPMPTKGPGE